MHHTRYTMKNAVDGWVGGSSIQHRASSIWWGQRSSVDFSMQITLEN
jgi:hypothetical protein